MNRAAPGTVASIFDSGSAGPAKPHLLAKLDRLCLSSVARWLQGAGLELQLWDGSTIPASGAAVGSLTIKDRATLWRVMRHPGVALAESYTTGRIEVTGDLTRIMESVNLALAARRRPTRDTGPREARATTLTAARQNIHHHYDLGNAFYRLWLDDAMVYTCAYFERPDLGLEEAQQAKLDYVCRKLALREGERVIEAGCGWGALAIYMATHYGATVRAYNISAEQLVYARAEAARQGVANRVTFIDGDCRSITGECDAFVSIGMLEHIGLAEYPALGRVIDRVIDRTNGRGLLHFIGRSHAEALDPWSQRYIFPGAYAPVLSEVTAAVLEPWSLSVVDVENLRAHYVQTLRHWRMRFERSAARVAEMFDDRFVRMWRLYLAAAEASFTTGNAQLFQVAFGRDAGFTGRWTRAELYSPPPETGEGRALGQL